MKGRPPSSLEVDCVLFLDAGALLLPEGGAGLEGGALGGGVGTLMGGGGGGGGAAAPLSPSQEVEEYSSLTLDV